MKGDDGERKEKEGRREIHRRQGLFDQRVGDSEGRRVTEGMIEKERAKAARRGELQGGGSL